MNGLDGFVASVLRTFLERRRHYDRVRDVVLLDFELDSKSRVRKSDVHASLARRLGVGNSPDMILDLREALKLLPDVRGVIRRGRHYYVGLRARPGRLATSRANAGVPKSPEQLAKQRATWLKKRGEAPS